MLDHVGKVIDNTISYMWSRRKLCQCTVHRIGNFLIALSRNPDLDVRVLCWKSAMPVAATQHFFPFMDRRAFAGTKVMSEHDVAAAAKVPLGAPVSTDKLEDARRRIVDWYKELGYYYVDVKYTLEPSADNTRARVRFDVSEGDQVIVSSIVVPRPP